VLGLAEFAAVTGIFLGPRRNRLLKLSLAIAILPIASFMLTALITIRTPINLGVIVKDRPDAPEYLPAGIAKRGITENRRFPDLTAFRNLPRGTRIDVLRRGPTVIGHANFPIWQVVHNGKVIPHSGALISFNAPEQGTYFVQRKMVSSEIFGWATFCLSIMAALALLFMSLKPKSTLLLKLGGHSA